MNTLIIDYFNLVKRYTFLLDEVPDDGEFYSDLSSKIVNKIINQIKTYSIDFLVVCSDLGFNFRANSLLKGEYKANRSRAKSLTQEEKEKDYINKLKDILKSFPCIFIEIKDVEADNLIYFVINRLKTLNSENKFYIASSDTDFLQLISEDVNILNWNKGLVTIDNWKEIHKFDSKDFKPKDYAILKAIVGDVSDNIKGIKGIGWGTILKLLNIVYSKLGKTLEISNINNLIDYLSELLANYDLDKKEYSLVKRIYDKIIENRDQINTNFSIIALDLLETPYVVKIMNSFEQAINTPVTFSTKDFLTKLKFRERFESDIYYQEILNKNMKTLYEIKRLASRMEKTRKNIQEKNERND